MFEKGNRAAAGTDRTPRTPRNKPYSEAARQLLECPIGRYPEGWPEDRKLWTNAQEMAERHITLARSGDLDVARLMIGRVEGKEPMAPEDREAATEGGGLFGGLSALNALRAALGMGPIVEVEYESVPPAKPVKRLKGNP